MASEPVGVWDGHCNMCGRLIDGIDGEIPCARYEVCCDCYSEIEEANQPSGYAYYDDEWYDEDDEPGISGTSCSHHIGKAKNGQLYTYSVWGYCYYGQDWGETSDEQWETETYSLKDLKPNVRRAALRQGRLLAPGEEAHFYWNEHEFGKGHKPSAAYFAYQRRLFTSWRWGYV